MEALFKTGGVGGHDREMLGMTDRARWRGQTQTEPASSTVLFSLGAKMLCNRIAKAIAGDSIAALRRPVSVRTEMESFLGTCKAVVSKKRSELGPSHTRRSTLPSLASDFGLSQITPQPCASRYRQPSLAPTPPAPN